MHDIETGLSEVKKIINEMIECVPFFYEYVFVFFLPENCRKLHLQQQKSMTRLKYNLSFLFVLEIFWRKHMQSKQNKVHWTCLLNVFRVEFKQQSMDDWKRALGKTEMSIWQVRNGEWPTLTIITPNHENVMGQMQRYYQIDKHRQSGTNWKCRFLSVSSKLCS